MKIWVFYLLQTSQCHRWGLDLCQYFCCLILEKSVQSFLKQASISHFFCQSFNHAFLKALSTPVERPRSRPQDSRLQLIIGC